MQNAFLEAGKVAWSVADYIEAYRGTMCRAKIRSLISEGVIPSIKLGSRRVITIPPREFMARLQQQAGQAE